PARHHRDGQSELLGDGLGDDLAVTGCGDGQGLACQPGAVACGEHLGVRGAEFAVGGDVAAFGVDAERVEQPGELLLTDGLDDLVAWDHELAAWHGPWAAASTVIRFTEFGANAA